MPKIIINRPNTVNLFLKTAIIILVISNDNSFRVLFDKNCFRIFYLKNAFVFALKMASPGNRHYANCIGALSSR